MRILYIAYWGLLEPLGQSLILPAVKLMAEKGISITLITFEKPNDLREKSKVLDTAELLKSMGVDWRPLRYHKKPTIPATFYDIAQGLFVAIRSAFQQKPDIIQGRTFIGGVICAFLQFIFGRPFVYHGEGFWPDQQVEGGFWREDSLVYKVCKAIDRFLYGCADGIILLSRTSQSVIQSLPRVRRRNVPIVIVPSCVDLERFNGKSLLAGTAGFRLIYIGSLGGRYPIEPLGYFLQAMQEADYSAKLKVLSQSDPDLIRTSLRSTGVPDCAVEVSRCPHEDIPFHLLQAQVGLFFLNGGLGAESCSPTKVGEYWACGIPVVTTPGAGDTDAIIHRLKVGIIIRDLTQDGYQKAVGELLELLSDPDLPVRCRRAAEEYYSLSRAIDTQLNLYQLLASKNNIDRATVFSNLR